MRVDRRALLAGSGAAVAATAADAISRGKSRAPSKRIAVEEAWSFPEHQAALSALTHSDWNNLDIENLRVPGLAGSKLHDNLIDTDRRLAEMDRLGIDMHVLSLTSPGLQLFDTDDATAMAAIANDRLAEIVRARPTRFAGLASFGPQDPKRAAKEMERAINGLKLNGFIVNSHTNNEYLDDPKYWPILEAAEALERPLYIHPRCPADTMAAPFRDHRMRAAIWGYQAETGLHAMRLIVSGVLDRFPRLQIVIGHMGENVPFHLWRSDNWYGKRAGTYGSKLKPSEVMRRNFHITTSGVAHGPALRYAVEVLGPSKVLWAIDYPYEDMEPATRFIDSVEIPEDVRDAVAYGNAARVFRIAL